MTPKSSISISSIAWKQLGEALLFLIDFLNHRDFYARALDPSRVFAQDFLRGFVIHIDNETIIDIVSSSNRSTLSRFIVKYRKNMYIYVPLYISRTNVAAFNRYFSLVPRYSTPHCIQCNRSRVNVQIVGRLGYYKIIFAISP